MTQLLPELLQRLPLQPRDLHLRHSQPAAGFFRSEFLEVAPPDHRTQWLREPLQKLPNGDPQFRRFEERIDAADPLAECDGRFALRGLSALLQGRGVIDEGEVT